ncbi:Hsp70 family protein [Mycobacterium shimoidei]|uniref:Hsp70 family protein n=1 Tax=Mycobacterium shimoidei TaxID=29313 RepID=UPI0008496CAA|nr:Hsp70 family protein [Mycobacterium shimoidei]MCV7257597.1 Hsp70 family protein [Mycobacterium shimoidei]ODR13489.1 hypothetical protein BHQ16_10730 [Mycobacterium shimoidei]ORW81637.1 hypothetical protein AWC26_08395 [Mycobacterium shimoidei]
MFDPLGLSIGTTNFVAVRNGVPPVTRRALLTVYPHRRPEIGLPQQNSGSIDTGSLMAGFVERVGSATPLTSAGGTTHDPALLLVEALDAMISATGGDASTSEITIAVPAHWKAEAVRALRNALRTHAGFVRSGTAPILVSDAITALTALNSDARLPAEGVVALLDFGGSGTNITLADAGSGFVPITETVRCTDFSGDHLDQALLVHVLEHLGPAGGIDPESTAVVARFAQLRQECTNAKERLSTETVTELVAELPAGRSTVQLSRAELEHIVDGQLNAVLAAFDDILARNSLDRRDLAAVAMAGGGASIPLVAQRLSADTETPLVTADKPALAMAVGALMFDSRRATEELAEQVETPAAMAALVGASVGASAGNSSATTDRFDATTGGFGLPDLTDDTLFDDVPPGPVQQLAWSEADETGNDPLFYTGAPYEDEFRAPPSQVLPKIELPPTEVPQRRYRLPQLALGLAALVAMVAVGGVAYSLTSATGPSAPPAPSSSKPVPASPPASSPPPSLSPSPLAPPPPSAAPAPSEVPPPPSSVEVPPPPPPVTTTHSPPPSSTTPQQTTTSTTTPTTTSSTAPTTTTTTTRPPSSSTSTPTTVPMTTEYLTLPLVPVPIPVQVPQNQAPPPQNPYLNPGGGYYPGGGY